VAEVNVDGANLWGETDDVIAQGAERSELGAFVRARADEMGLTIMPDAEPEKGFFFRSDHFPFALAGVPSLYIEHGRRYRGRPEGWGDSIQTDYTALHYHAPSDEFSEDFVFEGAVQQGRLALLTILDIANDDGWPNWLEGSEFKAARDAMR
jgi:Zn-dependent M28 family amino/carboxypeptidase